MQPRDARLDGALGRQRLWQTRTDGPAILAERHQGIESAADADHQRIEPLIGQQDVRAEPDGIPAHTFARTTL